MQRSPKGIKKTYWITCNVDPDIQQLSLDRRRFPNNFVVRPCDVNGLLANFQSSLQEFTLLQWNATPILLMLQVNLVGKLFSFEATLILPKILAEEFVQYAHNGNPADVTFAVKELKEVLQEVTVVLSERQVPEERILKAGGQSWIKSYIS
ncbi:hypothetical protein EUGRSUZ_H04575 [Eucalyptus grandis]|uniref:Uncharacterized protein n=2 Tax=Eucalyptus grandis TaxID=71139 RepID=A0ACC3JXH1_EUCGR|nr:hypothetical protein EUGRSUZ_H04575 [Eucalyptus grandis]